MALISLLSIETNSWASPPHPRLFCAQDTQEPDPQDQTHNEGTRQHAWALSSPLPAWVYGCTGSVLMGWLSLMGKGGTRNLIVSKYFTHVREKIILFPQAVLTLPDTLSSRPVLAASLLFVWYCIDAQCDIVWMTNAERRYDQVPSLLGPRVYNMANGREQYKAIFVDIFIEK